MPMNLSFDFKIDKYFLRPLIKAFSVLDNFIIKKPGGDGAPGRFSVFIRLVTQNTCHHSNILDNYFFELM